LLVVLSTATIKIYPLFSATADSSEMQTNVMSPPQSTGIPKVKCQQCVFHGELEQAEFPRKPNLQYLQDLRTTHNKQSGGEAVGQGWGQIKATCQWSGRSFQPESTLEENKDSAFEPHAVNTLENDKTVPKAPTRKFGP
jgi:hypothetical protein